MERLEVREVGRRARARVLFFFVPTVIERRVGPVDFCAIARLLLRSHRDIYRYGIPIHFRQLEERSVSRVFRLYNFIFSKQLVCNREITSAQRAGGIAEVSSRASDPFAEKRAQIGRDRGFICRPLVVSSNRFSARGLVSNSRSKIYARPRGRFIHRSVG